MFPVSDFNFIFCSFATFAATVGYAYSRRLVSSPSSLSHQLPSESEHFLVQTDESDQEIQDNNSVSSIPESEHYDLAENNPSNRVSVLTDAPTMSRRPSLKRKRAEDDDYSNAGYPYNLLSIYPPSKRSKTPPSEPKKDNEPRDKEGVELSTPESRTNESDTMSTKTGMAQHEKAVDQTEQPETSEAVVQETTSFDSPTRQPSFGFAAFAGSRSAFGSTRLDGSATTNTLKSIWRGPDDSTAQCNEDIKSSPNSSSTNEPHDTNEDCAPLETPSRKDAIEPAAIPSTKPNPLLTGEEDEDVEMELKNTKLFIKRGQKNFSEGMVGHIKLLSNKTTLNERLVFRREPLWKVSMNIRLQPTVRCSYDAEEHILRLILPEPVETKDVPPEQWPMGVVVYALKPARSLSKKDFADFAQSLMASSNLKNPKA